MRAHYLLHRLAVSAAIGLAPLAALSQSSASDLRAAVDAAWQRAPQARTLEAARGETLAGNQAARSWIAGSPSVGVSHRSDRWTHQDGLRENEVSLSAPIWLPGQKFARERLARHGEEELEAQIVHARLTVAGEVRERFWAAAAAREALSGAQDHLHHLKELRDEVMRRVNAGDLARIDGLLAQQEVLAAQNLVSAAQAKEREALARYTVLTGQADIPHAEPELLAAAQNESHPRILAVRSALAKAQASLQTVHATRSEPPTLGLSMRQERDSDQSATSNSIGVAIQIPLGTRGRNLPREAAAQTLLATAAAEAAQAQVALQADIELSRQQLALAESALGAANERARLTREHTQLLEKAFRLGERGLAELLRSQALSHEAEQAARQQRVAVGTAHARLNQALGIVP